MFRQVLILYSLVFFFSASSSAKIWYVDNKPGNHANFQQLADAISNPGVFDGDTLYISGSGAQYNSASFTKKLVLIGPGYFLSENDQTQSTPYPANINFLEYRIGSAGSVIIGVEVNAGIVIYVDSIYICRVRTLFAGVHIRENVNSITIIQSYLSVSNNYGQRAVNIEANCHNLVIRNCFLDGHFSSIVMAGNSDASFINNVFGGGGISISNSVFFNNILFNSGDFNWSGNFVKFNFSTTGNLPDTNGNHKNIPAEQLLLLTGSTDGRFKLKETSPARNAGINNEDCGMFGGENPYVLSGLPPCPAIYHTNIPSYGTVSGLPVTIKVKSQK